MFDYFNGQKKILSFFFAKFLLQFSTGSIELLKSVYAHDKIDLWICE